MGGLPLAAPSPNAPVCLWFISNITAFWVPAIPLILEMSGISAESPKDRKGRTNIVTVLTD